MITSTDRGHEIYYKNGNWYYSDDDSSSTHKRPCKHCNQPPTKEGYDACLGYLSGVKSACCGHGDMSKKIYLID